jgi:hypothetical protein
VLQRPAAVRGRVVDAEGEPAAGAEITASYPGRLVTIYERNHDHGTADATGAFHLTGLDLGSVELRAWRGHAQGTRVLVLTAGETARDVELRLEGD